MTHTDNQHFPGGINVIYRGVTHKQPTDTTGTVEREGGLVSHITHTQNTISKPKTHVTTHFFTLNWLRNQIK